MVEDSSEEAAIALKKSLWWVNEGVDRLAIKWIAVSTEPGGPGNGQRLDVLGPLPIGTSASLVSAPIPH